MRIFSKVAIFIVLTTYLFSVFSLYAKHEKREKNKDEEKFIILNRKKDKFLDINPNDYTPTGRNDLVDIQPFSSDFPATVVAYHHSQMNNGSAFFTFEVPDFAKKEEEISLDLVFLTPPAAEKMRGRIAFEAHFDVVKKNGDIDIDFASQKFNAPWVFEVKSSSMDKVAKTFSVTLVGNDVKFKPGDTVIVTLSRLYRVPENFPETIALLSTRIHWNEVSMTNQPPLKGTAGPTFHCNCHVKCLSPVCLFYQCTGTHCHKTAWKIFTKCGC